VGDPPMTSLADMAKSQSAVKLLLLGNSGVGKTGSIATLAKSYRIMLADFEAGYDILLDKTVLPTELRKNVFVKSFVDKRTGPRAVPVGGAKAILQFHDALMAWKEGEANFGSIYTWTDKDVLVLDSLTFFSKAAELHAQSLSNRAGQPLQFQEYGAAQGIIEGILAMLYSDEVKCHVVVTGHLKATATDSGTKHVVQTSGKALDGVVQRYFNDVVLMTKEGFGAKTTRLIHTVSTMYADLKTSRPGSVPATMEPDLDKLFTLLRAT
jgi:hypothetical protein